jgi:hypothetical protein
MPDEKKYPRASKVSKMADAAVEDMLDFPRNTAQGMGRYGLAAASYLPAAAVDTVERIAKKKKDSEDVEKKDDGGRTKYIDRKMPEGKGKDVLMGTSRFFDKMGLRQDKTYEGKSDEEIVKKRSGGKVSSASKRADGCAQKGKTKGRMV